MASTFVDVAQRNYYDISQDLRSPFPPPFFNGYLNQPHVQRALGVPVNFTQSSRKVSVDFSSTGDLQRGDGPRSYLQDIADILDAGTRVALVYGDRDWICNWVGGENVSVHVPYSGQDAFKAAGYANLTVNASSTGGLTREVGSFSFSRIFQAGHEIPAFQPEASLAVFNRTMHGLDIATGSVAITPGGNHATTGPNNTLSVRQEPPPMLPLTCYLYALDDTCNEMQQQTVLNGSGLVHNYILIDANHTDTFPTPTPTGMPAASSSATAARLLWTGNSWIWEGPWALAIWPTVAMVGSALMAAAVL